jgi:hypothetical protein
VRQTGKGRKYAQNRLTFTSRHIYNASATVLEVLSDIYICSYVAKLLGADDRDFHVSIDPIYVLDTFVNR